ncbi:MAG: hypothetical protein H6590_06475 [Flavobacteriales bacterium]|nr:hypothetical protein [Flavobacteriales bacterium]
MAITWLSEFFRKHSVNKEEEPVKERSDRANIETAPGKPSSDRLPSPTEAVGDGRVMVSLQHELRKTEGHEPSEHRISARINPPEDPVAKMNDDPWSGNLKKRIKDLPDLSAFELGDEPPPSDKSVRNS